MVDPTALVPSPPPNEHPENEMWVDEQIWGHRLLDSQSPWLLFLEFLSIAEACRRDDHLLDERGTYTYEFRPHQRMFLRNILFNNEELFRIGERYPDSRSAWSIWLAWMAENAKAVPSRDFSYIQDRFSSFQQFASLVAMLRSSAPSRMTPTDGGLPVLFFVWPECPVRRPEYHSDWLRDPRVHKFWSNGRTPIHDAVSLGVRGATASASRRHARRARPLEHRGCVVPAERAGRE